MAGLLAQVLILCCLALVRGDQTKFCDLASCYGRPHTMCLFPSETPAASCGEMKGKGLTPEEKKAILERHNHWRARVASGKEMRGINGPQPAAKNLGSMTWNDEIAEYAQRWADQCSFQHDHCRNTAKMLVGQNIAFIGSTAGWNNDNLVQMVDNWYNEVEHFDRNKIRNFRVVYHPRALQVYHYTQMVWAKSTMLGCGASRYRKQGDRYYITYLVCNYAPTGNFIGQPVYEIE
ncbi:venom allergen 3 [Diachasma alloeum]|uniref:venom allergen 3 n=1 Tax=Diachasma alloeum TaxID=454923 RepID=UPI00073840CD|nr:venom allergen 3 [Diachasma alloeum]XP_015121041.1 venom allergen 3 [Diachasma alloeum]